MKPSEKILLSTGIGILGVSVIAFILMVAFMPNPIPPPGKHTFHNITINRHTTQHDLDTLKAAFKEGRVYFKLDSYRYNSQGELQMIAGKVQKPLSGEVSFATDSLESIKVTVDSFDVSVDIKGMPSMKHQNDVPVPEKPSE